MKIRALLLAVAALWSALGTGAPAHAADCSGVTVIVDFGSLGGGVRTGCAPGDPASGISALTSAGFTYSTVTRTPGFICRINGKPTEDAEKCVVTPPETAYWAYFHAPRGGSWTYSSFGAGAYDPKPGTVEGWAFGSGGQPSVAPPAAPQPTQPAPTTSKPAPVSTPTPPTPVESASPAPSTSDSPTPSDPASPSSTPVAQAPAAAKSSPAGLIAAGALIVLLGGVASYYVIRRRRSSGS